VVAAAACDRSESRPKTVSEPQPAELVSKLGSALPLALIGGFPEQIDFNVPERCDSNPDVCCGYPIGYCQVHADLKARPGDPPRVEIKPIGQNGDRFGVTIRARMWTPRSLPTVTYRLLFEIDCNVDMDSTWSGSGDVTMYFELHFVADSETGGTRAQVENADASGITGDDIDIWGQLLCDRADPDDAADQMMTTFRERLPGAVEQMLCKKCTSDSDCGNGATCEDSGDGEQAVCTLPSGRCLQG
jgi:hypothetical protein